MGARAASPEQRGIGETRGARTPNRVEMRREKRRVGGREEAVSSAGVQEDDRQSLLGAQCLGPGRGRGKRPGPGEGSKEQCPEL